MAHLKLEHNKATCLRCGAISAWRVGVEMQAGRPLTYWTWLNGFKKRHRHDI